MSRRLRPDLEPLRLARGFSDNRDVGSALTMLDGAQYWKLSSRACTVVVTFRRHKSRASVRRKAGEALEAMIVRCVRLAAARYATPDTAKPSPLPVPASEPT
jgi:hypothetical protein